MASTEPDNRFRRALSLTLPLPPADLHTRSLPIREISEGASARRFVRRGVSPLWFGPAPGTPPLYRFDDPRAEYGVCYVANRVTGAFAETFLRDLPVRGVALTTLAERECARLEFTRPIRAVQFMGPGLVLLGTTAATAGALAAPPREYAHSQAWSRACYDHPDQPDGIFYRSSHDDSEFCLALFERARDAMRDTGERFGLLVRPTVLANLCKRYQLALL